MREMSLEILILAAEFLEWRSKTKTRGNDISTDFSIYEEQVKTSSNSASPPSQPPPPPAQPPPGPPPPPLPPLPPLPALQPLPEQPTTSTSSPSPSFFLPPTSPQSPQSGSDQKSKNGDKNDKRRAGGAGTREVHNKLEKNRRAHMKEMFEYLRSQIPQLEDKKNSNLSILRNAIRYIQTLRRKEKDYELEVQKLAQNKIALQDRLRRLRRDTSLMHIEFPVKDEPDSEEEEEEEDIDTYSTSTASEGGDPIMSDVDEEKTQVAHKENSQHMKNLERQTPSILASQALSSLIGATQSSLIGTASPTFIGAASPRVTFASSSSMMSATTPLPGSIKPLKNNIGFPTGATSVITNNTNVFTTNITQHNSNSSWSTNSYNATPQRPVMEILHKTLAQRKALHKHKQLIGNSASNTQSEITSAQVTTVQSSKLFRTATQLKPQNSIRSVIPLPTASVNPGLQSTGIKLAALTIPVNKPTKMAITPHKKIVVETLPASVPPGMSVAAALSSTSPSPSATGSLSSTTVPSALTAIVRTPTAHPIVSQTVPMVSAVKQILTPSGSQLVSGSPLAVNAFQSQSITRTQILNTSMFSSPSVSTSTSSSPQISSMHPVMSITPVSQLVSPTVHVPSGLPQTAQLNMFPIIQSQLFPTNQVVGQSVTAKPLVMVTVPTTTVQVSVAMTPTTT